MATAAGITTVGFGDKRTQAAMRGANPDNFNIIVSGHMMRDPRRLIYIHSVSRRSFLVKGRMFFPNFLMAGCENGERSVLCGAIPDPISQPRPDIENGGTRINEHDGWRVTCDLLNVNNLTGNPYSGDNNPDFYANRSGQNYISEGLWPSLHKIAPEEEIKAAEGRRDRHYRYLTKEATRLAAVSTKELNEFLQTYPDTHIAMDALGMSANWHSLSIVKVSCPNCGDDIKQGLAFHRSSVTDRLCVIDAERAYRAKAITKDERDELLSADDEDSDGPAEKKSRKSRMQPVV